MSNNENTILIERAYHWSEECTNTSLGDQIYALLKEIEAGRGDLETLALKVKEAEDYHRYIDLMNDRGDDSGRFEGDYEELSQ